MLPHEEPTVRRLHAVCMPTWAPRPPHWYFLNPTTVVLDHRNLVVGARSVALDVNGLVMHLQGLMIAPEARGIGVGSALFRWDIDRGREMGVRSFFSATWPGNTNMRRLFEAQGFHHCVDAPGYYPENPPEHRDGLVYVRHEWPTVPPQCEAHLEKIA